MACVLLRCYSAIRLHIGLQLSSESLTENLWMNFVVMFLFVLVKL